MLVLHDLMLVGLSRFSEQPICAFTKITTPGEIESQAGELGSLASCMNNMICIGTIFAEIWRAYSIVLIPPEVRPDTCTSRSIFAQRFILQGFSALLADHS